jgi:hypothetical protein
MTGLRFGVTFLYTLLFPVSCMENADPGARFSNVEETGAMSDYVPQHIDVTGCLQNEARCCFVTARILKAAVVIADACAVGITTGAVTQINGNPGLATGLGICGAVSSGLSIVASLFLMKINSKLINIDKILAERKAAEV